MYIKSIIILSFLIYNNVYSQVTYFQYQNADCTGLLAVKNIIDNTCITDLFSTTSYSYLLIPNLSTGSIEYTFYNDLTCSNKQGTKVYTNSTCDSSTKMVLSGATNIPSLPSDGIAVFQKVGQTSNSSCSVLQSYAIKPNICIRGDAYYNSMMIIPEAMDQFSINTYSDTTCSTFMTSIKFNNTMRSCSTVGSSVFFNPIYNSPLNLQFNISFPDYNKISLDLNQTGWGISEVYSFNIYYINQSSVVNIGIYKNVKTLFYIDFVDGPISLYAEPMGTDLFTNQILIFNSSLFNVPKLPKFSSVTRKYYPYNILEVTYESIGGLPSDPTIYTISFQGVLVTNPACSKGPKCNITIGPIDQTANLQLYVNNNGKQDSLTTNIVNELIEPQFSIIDNNTISETNSITVFWTKFSNTISSAGSISIDNSNYYLICPFQKQRTDCKFANLLPSTEYYFRIDMMENVTTEVIYMANTPALPPSNVNYCINPSSTSTSGIQLNCTGNGQCLNNLCICKKDYVGKYCETITPIEQKQVVSPSPSQPVVSVSTTELNFQFSVGIINEKSENGAIEKSLDISTLNWTLVSSKSEKITSVVNNDTVQESKWIYSAVNLNSTFAKNISIVFSQYSAVENSNITKFNFYSFLYADQEYSVQLGSTKFSLEIQQWNFDNSLNFLEILTMVSSVQSENPDYDGCGDNSLEVDDKQSDITTILLKDGNGNFISGRLINRVILDQIPRYISNRAEYKNGIVTMTSIVPKFDQTLFLDPDFSLLVVTDKNTCDKEKDSVVWKIIVGVVVGSVALAAIAILFIVRFVQKKWWWKK